LFADTTIGRDPDNDIYINDTALSALHVRVKMVNGHFIAYDQKSTNGLFTFNLERERWEKKEQVLLQEGTRIKMGRTVLVFMSVDAAN
jgi:pSer/pThr/pTyr-binding forkhead associated (FHA) protein